MDPFAPASQPQPQPQPSSSGVYNPFDAPASSVNNNNSTVSSTNFNYIKTNASENVTNQKEEALQESVSPLTLPQMSPDTSKREPSSNSNPRTPPTIPVFTNTAMSQMASVNPAGVNSGPLAGSAINSGGNNMSLVPTMQPANQWNTNASMTPTQPQQPGVLNPSMMSLSQPPPVAQPSPSISNAAMQFDPFASKPSETVAVVPSPAQTGASNPYNNYSVPPQIVTPPPAIATSQTTTITNAQQQPPTREISLPSSNANDSNEYLSDFSRSTRGASVSQKLHSNNNNNNSNNNNNNSSIKNSSGINMDNIAPPPVKPKGYHNSLVLARNAPPNASPLPIFDQITHSGFILSRISFRTILMKKWKQSFWITYGNNQLIFFRSMTDFEEWATNPYLTHNQRNFLVKLKVDLISDLYKPNVRGYQVTNVRFKAYKDNLLYQFKLERWMDYGPTIAAAFASPQEHEAQDLRIVLLELMKKNSPDYNLRDDGNIASPRIFDSQPQPQQQQQPQLQPQQQQQPQPHLQSYPSSHPYQQRQSTNVSNHMATSSSYLPTRLSNSHIDARATPYISSSASVGGGVDDAGSVGGNSVRSTSVYSVGGGSGGPRRRTMNQQPLTTSAISNLPFY